MVAQSCFGDNEVDAEVDYRRSSADAHVDPEQTDVLRGEGMLVRWGRRLELLDERAEPASAAEEARARALRDIVHRVFSSISGGEEPAKKDLEVLISDYLEAVERGLLSSREGAYELDWEAADPRRVRFAVAADTIALLQDSSRLARVSRCPGRGCGWLFLNVSGRRRWCSMSTCGSREKMRRLHRRRKQRSG